LKWGVALLGIAIGGQDNKRFLLFPVVLPMLVYAPGKQPQQNDLLPWQP